MTPNKRYVANKRQQLQIVVALADGQTTITFNGGYGLRPDAYYITNDEALQNALEKDSRFNVSYRLDEIDNVSTAEYQAKSITQESKEANLPVKTFRTNTEAKDWINEYYHVPYNRITNKVQLIAEYEKQGFKLEFENT